MTRALSFIFAFFLVGALVGCTEEGAKVQTTESTVEYVTTASFTEKVLEADKPVLVDFTATWCAPCRLVDPIIESIAPEMEGRAYVYKLDIDQSPEIYDSLRVNGVPTVLFFNQGQEEDRITSPQSRETYVQYLESMIGGDSAEEATLALLEMDSFRRHFLLSRDVEAVSAFATQRPDILTQPFENGQTTLSLVLNRPSVRQNQLVDMILATGIEVQDRELVGLGRCGELEAAIERDPDMVRRPDPDGAVPLFVAMARERRLPDGGCLSLLERHLPDLSSFQHPYYNLNRFVILGQNSRRLARYLEKGLNPSARDQNGFNALHIAAQFGIVDMVNILIDHGMDPTVATDEGKTALDLVSDAMARTQQRLEDADENARSFHEERLEVLSEVRDVLEEASLHAS